MDPVIAYIPYDDQLLLFPNSDPVTFWTTNGTVSGTKPFKRVDNDHFITRIDYSIVDNVVYFTQDSDEALWRTDATECGTFAIRTGLSNIWPVESIGNNLIIGGYGSFLYGRELYRYNSSYAPESPCGMVAARASAPAANLMISSSEEEIVSTSPNPFTEDFTLYINSRETMPAQVAVYSVTGTAVQFFEELPCNTVHRFGQQWPAGLYFMKVTLGEKTTTKKLIKK
jgi:hypothetical protein